MDGKTPVCRAKFLDRGKVLHEQDVLTAEALVAHPFRADFLQKAENMF
jgi:hypothetical protein